MKKKKLKVIIAKPKVCTKHPKYKAICKPRAECLACWKMYRYKHRDFVGFTEMSRVERAEYERLVAEGWEALRPHWEACRRSEQISAEDLRIVINTKD